MGGELERGREVRRRFTHIWSALIPNLSVLIRTLKSGHDKGAHNGHDKDTITLSGRGNHLIAMANCMLARHSYSNVY